MSKQTERKFILNMLAAGTINTDQAQNLLEAIRPNKNAHQSASDTIVVEMDADKENVRSVLDKLNKAIFG